MPGKSLNVISICGSLRKGSINAIVQRALPSLAPEGLAVRPAPSFAEFPLYNADVQAASGFPAPVNALADAIRAADGVIIVSPEYNFSIPGGLKNALDWVSRLPNQPFAGKPVALQSASPGPVGGARVQYDLRRAMVFLDAFVLNKPEIFIGGCAAKIDEQTGEVKDEATRNFIRQQLAAFVKFIAQLAPRA
ncbi:MAG TPA: NADPH-dependent FMN reductase [Xanthobacteraceae bacterium]|jgi:chromate reductase